jgi:KaiC/GvpD/RAD55 family RecA-like ATPase
MTIQYCAAAVAAGKKVVYVCIEQDPEEIRKQASQLGLDIEKVLMISAKDIKYGIGKKPDDIDEKIVLVLESLRKLKPDVLVIDSISSLQIEDGIKARLLEKKLVDGIKGLGATTLVTGEALNGDYPDMTIPFLVDNVILLYYVNFGTQAGRSLVIKKMRLTAHSEEVHPIKIDSKKGIILVSL